MSGGIENRRLLTWHGLQEGAEVIALVITAVDTVDIEADIDVGIIATIPDSVDTAGKVATGSGVMVIEADILPIGDGTDGT